MIDGQPPERPRPKRKSVLLPPRQLAGFDIPRPAQNILQKQLFEKYKVPENPSLSELEPLVKNLLREPKTLTEAVQIVLGRELDPQNPEDLKAITTLALSSNLEVKFGMLLAIKTVDESKVKQKNKK